MSDYPTKLDFCDGKYTVIYNFKTGQSECLRYGKPWRQLVGDKMVLAMFDRVVELQAENAALKNKLEMVEACLAGNGALIEGLKAEVEQWQKSVCEQGEVIEALKAELDELKATTAAGFDRCFEVIGSDVDRKWSSIVLALNELAAAQKDAFRAGMLAAADLIDQLPLCHPGRADLTVGQMVCAIREAAK